LFELDEYEEEQNYILVMRKLEMHGNQKTSYGTEHRVDDWSMCSVPCRFVIM